MTTRRTPPATVMRLWVGVALLTQAGCMSALTSVSLREAVLETVDSLAEVSAGRPPRETRDAEVSASVATDAPAVEQPEPMTLDEAVDRAVARLKSAGRLDAATQATLLTILESTQPEDWPAAIDAFTASLETRPPSPRAMAVIAEPSAVIGEDGATAPTAVDPPPVARDDAPTTSDPLPVPPPAEPEKLDVVAARPVVPEPPLGDEAPAVPPPAPPVASELVANGTIASSDDKLRPGDESGSGALAVIDDPIAAATAGVAPPAVPEPTTLPRPLIVRNSCFVSRVRAWGVVDRFQQHVFRPGQEVIVYFELDAPLARESAGGHATSIDTVFRLVAADGREIGRWAFEPIDESCDSPRRDYFARYFLRMPEDAPPGPCRLEFVVTDLVAGLSTPAQLDLELR